MNRDTTGHQVWLGSGPNGRYTERALDSMLSSLANRKEAPNLTVRVATPRPQRDSAHRVESELWRLVLTDKLTGLCNQQGFIALAEHHWRITRRQCKEMAFIGIELHGPDASRDRTRGELDLAVMSAGRILSRCFRRSDVVCHWEGLQFRVLLVGEDGLDEPMLSERIDYQSRNSSRPAGYPLLFRGRLTRINPRSCDTPADLWSLLEQELAQPGQMLSGRHVTQHASAMQDTQ